MKKPLVYLFVFNGFADWEPAYAISGLQKYGQYQVQKVLFSMKKAWRSGTCSSDMGSGPGPCRKPVRDR